MGGYFLSEKFTRERKLLENYNVASIRAILFNLIKKYKYLQEEKRQKNDFWLLCIRTRKVHYIYGVKKC